MLGTNFKRAISAINAKSRLLSLPPELRLRIFEYVFGTLRHHVKIKGNYKKWHVHLARCEVELESGTHTYRTKTLEEQTSSPPDPISSYPVHPDHRRHQSCHYTYAMARRRREPIKGHKRRLPQSLLLTCKTIHSEAALIMWHNHVFELELFSNDLPKFVKRMTLAQRKALRTIAFDIRAKEMHHLTPTTWTMPSPTFTPVPSAPSLLVWLQPMRDSSLALPRLRRMELFIDAWSGRDPTDSDFVFPADVLIKVRPGAFCKIGDWIPLLERRELEDVEVRVEKGLLRQPGIGSHRNSPFVISAQQRAEWEEQVELIIRGRSLELVERSE